MTFELEISLENFSAVCQNIFLWYDTICSFSYFCYYCIQNTKYFIFIDLTVFRLIYSLCLAIICQICAYTNGYGAIFYFCVGRHRVLDHLWTSDNVYDSLQCQIRNYIGWADSNQSPIPKIRWIKWHIVLAMLFIVIQFKWKYIAF